MKKLRLVFALFTLFCSIFPTPAAVLANEYANRSLTRRERKFDTVVILPTQVMAVQTGFRGATEMFKEAKALETELSTLVEWAIRQKNPGLRPVWISSEGTAEDVNRSYLLADVQARFDRLLPSLLDDPGRVRRGGYTMTDAVAKLAPQQSETLLVFTRLVGVDATLFASFFGFREGAQLIVSMVDGVSGEAHVRHDSQAAPDQPGCVERRLQLGAWRRPLSAEARHETPASGQSIPCVVAMVGHPRPRHRQAV